MTIATKIIFIAALILSIIIPFGYYLIGEKNKKRYKRTIGINAFFFFGAFAIASVAMLAGPDSVMQPQPQPMVRLSPQAWATLQQHS